MKKIFFIMTWSVIMWYIVGHTLSKQLKIYIIYFGKACLASWSHAKHYKLFPEEIEVYKKEHSQIAPDLRDGLVPQSAATDVYSLGRIFKKIVHSLFHLQHDAVKKIAKQSLTYHSHERPSVFHIVEVVTKLCKKWKCHFVYIAILVVAH